MDELLQSAYVNVNLPRSKPPHWTPLLAAAMNGHPLVTSLLLRHGAQINYVDHANRTALYIAATQGHSSVVTVLLNNKADIHIANRTGNH